MVTVVDALNLFNDYHSEDLLVDRGQVAGDEDNRSLASLLTEQMEFANVIVVSKTDLVDAARLDLVNGVIKSLNPGAQIVYAEKGNVPLERILGTKLFDHDQSEAMPGWARELEGQHTPETEEYGITSFVYTSREPLHPARFNDFIHKPLPGVLRAKGYLWLASRPQWAISYSRAGNTANIEPVGFWWAATPRDRWPPHGDQERALIESNWQEPYGDRVNEIVFIGQNINQSEIEQELKGCQLSFTEKRKSKEYWKNYQDPFPIWNRIEH